MSFNAVETSETGGNPIELYEFQYGATYFHYTSGQQDRTMNGYTWTAIPMRRENLAQTNEVLKSSLQLTVPRDNEVADLFRITPPSEVVTVKLYQYHASDGSLIVAFVGRVLNVKWKDEEATMVCDPAYAALQRSGLRRAYQLLCPHALYSPQCGVLIQNFRIQDVLTAVNGTSLTANLFSSQPNGWLNGGFIEFNNGLDGTERRSIVSHTGTTIQINLMIPQLVVGSMVSAYAGCAHNMSDCGTKFNNLLNYGGTPYIPQLNPFTGDPVY